MKIAIITHHWSYNFGANLQTLTTVKYLQKLGHQVSVINYRIPEKIQKYQKQVSPIQLQVHEKFCQKYLPESSLCSNQEDIINMAREEKFDVVISGSDAVLRLWQKNTREDTQFPNPFWLDWTDEVGIKRKGILAGSSMATDYWRLPSETKRGIREVLGKMDYISVRDAWTKILLSLINQNKYQVKFCPDPVFILNEVMSIPEEYVQKSQAEKGQYILLSLYKNTVSDQWIKDFVEVCHNKGFKVYTLPFPEYEVPGPVDQVITLPLSPLEWYAWIQNAAGYVGFRFHPIVSALVNQVPFVAFDRYERMYVRRPWLQSLTRPLFRFSSKTYDLCWRSQRAKYCFNKERYEKLSPKRVFSLLQEQMKEKTHNSFVSDCQKIFVKTIDNIIGQ